MVALARGGSAPPAVSFKVKNWRGNWAYWLPLWEGQSVLVFFPGFLEGTQLSSRWQEDEAQRQPGESLEGEPGSGSSQVLSWSALDKKGDGLLHMLLIAMPNHNEVPIHSLPLSPKGIQG